MVGCSQARSQALPPLSSGKGSVALRKPKNLQCVLAGFCSPPSQTPAALGLCLGSLSDPAMPERTEALENHSCSNKAVRAGSVKCWVTFPAFSSSWPVSYYCLPTARRKCWMGSDSCVPAVKYHQVEDMKVKVQDH